LILEDLLIFWAKLADLNLHRRRMASR